MNSASRMPFAELERPVSLGAFEGYGLELEYMIVARSTLDVLPIADQLLQGPEGKLAHGAYGWSNELVAHVVELKNIAPTAELDSLSDALQHETARLNAKLDERGARLMPGGMHPWMNPRTETRLWQHANAGIYEAYDRIFDCRTHGWANLQSTHINLPFRNDDEFARLHAAVRLVLPLIPAIAASSPFVEGEAPGPLDCRMEAYRTNSSALPSLTGQVVPDTVSTKIEYERKLLRPMYEDIAPHDAAGVLQHEWLNSRGAIARFSRNAIEIRVMDVQERPRADVGLAALIIDAVRALYEERPATLSEQQRMPTDALARVLRSCVREAEHALIDDVGYLRLFGAGHEPCEAGELWLHLADEIAVAGAGLGALWQPVLDVVMTRGTLARRLRDAAGPHPAPGTLRTVYEALCNALAFGEPFDP